jgi:hypothetical protein
MNPRSSKANISFEGRLDLTRNKVDISQFTDFDEKNSPIYGNTLSPLYSKKVANENYAVFNSKGDKFTYINNILYKNDVEVMKTKGNGYFSIKEVEEPKYWDTYDIWNGHVAKSKYENGVVRYYYDTTEYTWAASGSANSIVACRARILPNGTPIIAYVFATPTANQYQFVYLSNNVKQSYTGNTVRARVYTNQRLSASNAGTGTFVQNRNTAITVSNDNPVDQDKGFLNPLIQIANPLENVYVVSFISNHGGKINPRNELRYFNILNNNGTFYNHFNMNLQPSSIVEVPHERSLSLTLAPAITREDNTSICYAYTIPSGDAAWDAAHQADVGKYFTRVGQGGALENEIVFDEGYNPTWQSDVTEGVAPDTYTKYSMYQYDYHNDVLTVTASANGLASGDSLTVRLNYTPKVKTQGTKETYTFNNKTYQVYGDNALELYTKVSDNYVPVYKKKLIPNSGNDPEIYSINDKLSYQYRPKWNAAVVNGSFLAEESNLYVKLVSGATEGLTYRKASSPNMNIRRDIHSNVDKDGNPITPGTILPYDDYPVVYTTEQAYHEATVGETYNGVVIATEEDTYELDPYGEKIVADVAYWKQIYGSLDLLVPMNYDDVQVEVEPGVFEYVDVVEKYPTINGDTHNEVDADIKSTLYRTYFEIENTTSWINGQSAYFSNTFTSASSTNWTFRYDGNNVDVLAATLWNGFNTAPIATATVGGQAAQSFTLDTINVMGTTPLVWEHTFTWTTTQAANQVIVPNVVLDDGTFVYAGSFYEGNCVFPISSIFSFQGRVTHMTSADTFRFIATGFYNTGSAADPGCVLTSTIDIGPCYYRSVISMTNGTNSTSGQVTGLQVLYDSAAGTSFVDAGGLSSDVTSGTGWTTALFYNSQGSIADSGEGKWRYLYNSGGLLSGLSYGENEYIGTLLAEWSSIADDKYVYSDETHLGWHSTDGKWYEITEHVNETNAEISIIFDRYVIVPTNGFWNCYDIERGTPLHYATDFNNRCLAGINTNKYGNYIALANSVSSGFALSKLFTSGINSMYEVSGVAITSLQVSPQPYINIATGYETFVWCKADSTYQPQRIEVFAGINTNATSAEYQYSVIFYGTTSITLKDPNLVGLNSPVAIMAATYYSPNIFTEFIHTYNNKDLIKNGQYGYPIVYNETTPILSYSSGKQISNVDSVFVIQSQYYALIGGKIVSIVYDDYTVIGIDAIIDISGMKYLGYLPTKAYFWSPANKSLYSFTGDANLSMEMEANGIGEVYETFYSTQKEALFIATDKGVYVISDIQQYHIDTGVVKNIWFINDGYFIAEDVENKLTYYSYEKDLIPAAENEKIVRVPVIVETKYYGPGNGQQVSIDKVSVQFRSDVFEEGNIYFSCSTLTDIGFKSEEKKMHINANDIDKLTNSFIINYSPKWQKGQGFKVKIVSDYPIARITESITEMVENTSTKHNV